MEVKNVVVFLEICCLLLVSVRCSRLPRGNNVWKKNFPAETLETEYFDSLSAGPEKLPIDMFRSKSPLEEESEKESEVDEDTIRKAEKVADKDLLNGLNRILKNNETLKDVFTMENVYEIL